MENASVKTDDSLQVKFNLNVRNEKGKMQNLNAVLFDVPGKRYRLELGTTMGIGVASLLWKQGKWTMTFPIEKTYLRGEGNRIGIRGNTQFPRVDIHRIESIFRGRLLPASYKVISKSDSVVLAKDTSDHLFKFAKSKDSLLWIETLDFDGKPERVIFSGWKKFNGLSLPEEIEFKREGRSLLKMKIRRIRLGKTWSQSIWHLNIPRSYQNLNP